MIPGHADIDTAVNSLRDGAYDFISKPIDINRLITSVRNALDRENLVSKRLKFFKERILNSRKKSDGKIRNDWYF